MQVLNVHQNYDLFMASLLVILDLLRSKNYKNAETLITQLLNDEMDRKTSIIKKVYMFLDVYYDLLKSNNVKLFDLYTKKIEKVVKVTIIPGVDIGSVWKKLDETEQATLWSALKQMYVASSLMISGSMIKI